MWQATPLVEFYSVSDGAMTLKPATNVVSVRFGPAHAGFHSGRASEGVSAICRSLGVLQQTRSHFPMLNCLINVRSLREMTQSEC